MLVDGESQVPGSSPESVAESYLQVEVHGCPLPPVRARLVRDVDSSGFRAGAPLRSRLGHDLPTV
eukprot:3742087-Alexandrium_andersonii.AAC.1